MIGPEDETPRPPAGDGFGDAVSFAFGDADAELYGIARVGLSPAERRASAFAVLFEGTEPVVATVQGGVDLQEPGWDDISVGGLRARIVEPLSRWSVELQAQDGGFALEFAAASEPMELGAGSATASASGLEGYDQLCRVEGETRVNGRARRLSCLGQRGHGWGPAPWGRIELARTVTAWLEGPRAVMLSAVRPTGAAAHGDEAVTAFLVEPADGLAAPAPVAEPRLSTTYDAEGRQRRAGLELWMHEDDELPRRLAGEAACGTSLQLADLRLGCAFFRWRMEGRSGVGRYDVLRRA
ncbi:MAG TPA: hypothetical protein VKA96_04880 [Solirubrobacteraceae bacterium]|nr:hypothetical protein [Solirubrobacteraceae bacterium]